MGYKEVLYNKYFGIERRDWFLIIVFLTVILARIMLWFASDKSRIFTDSWHHLYYGLLLLIVVVILDRKWHYKILVPFSIAIGLIVDEFVFLMPGIYDATKAAYFGFPSTFGMFIMIFLVLIFRDKLLLGLEYLAKE